VIAAAQARWSVAIGRRLFLFETPTKRTSEWKSSRTIFRSSVTVRRLNPKDIKIDRNVDGPVSDFTEKTWPTVIGARFPGTVCLSSKDEIGER